MKKINIYKKKIVEANMSTENILESCWNEYAVINKKII